MKDLEELLAPKTAHSVWQAIRNNTEIIVLFGAVLLVVALIVFWALYIRKPDYTGVYSRLEEGPGLGLRRRRRKRKHRHHSHRNPTLAETGGFKKAVEERPDNNEAS